MGRVTEERGVHDAVICEGHNPVTERENAGAGTSSACAGRRPLLLRAPRDHLGPHRHRLPARVHPAEDPHQPRHAIARPCRVSSRTVGRTCQRADAAKPDPGRLDGLFRIGVDEISWRPAKRT